MMKKIAWGKCLWSSVEHGAAFGMNGRLVYKTESIYDDLGENQCPVISKSRPASKKQDLLLLSKRLKKPMNTI